MRSFNASGMPCSGPRQCPCKISASAVRACASADSAVTVMNAFSVGLSFSIAARQDFVNSTGDSFPFAQQLARFHNRCEHDFYVVMRTSVAGNHYRLTVVLCRI